MSYYGKWQFGNGEFFVLNDDEGIANEVVERIKNFEDQSVTRISGWAFADCSSLDQITLPEHFFANSEEYLRDMLGLSPDVIINKLTPNLSDNFLDARRRSEETNNPHQDQKEPENTK